MADFISSMDPTVASIIIGAFVVGLVLLLYFVLMSLREEHNRQQRVQRVQHGAPSKEAVKKQEQKLKLKRRGDQSSIKGLDAIIRAVVPRPAALRARLSRTGLDITVPNYVLGSTIVAALIAAVLKIYVGAPTAASALAGFAAGVGLPHMVVGFLIGRRVKKFLNGFPDAIDILVRGLKSGLPAAESIKVVGQEMTGPIGQEFSGIADGLALGQNMDDMMWDVAERLDIQEFKFFVISISVQRETGGNLGETLENLADVLRKRRQIVLKVKAMSSEAKASAIIIGSLPFVIFGILLLLNPGYVMQLFEDSRGLMMVGAGLASMMTGIAIMAKLVKFEI